MSEVWRPVVGYEGFFEVSSKGRVRSLDRIVPCSNGRTFRNKGRILSSFPRSGYRYVHLKVDGVDHKVGIHQIACRAFHGEPPVCAKPEVRHKDGSRTENKSSNLEWGTSSQNRFDMVHHGRHHNANKVECKRKHPFSKTNTQIKTLKDGRRVRCCLACRHIREVEYRQRKKLRQ